MYFRKIRKGDRLGGDLYGMREVIEGFRIVFFRRFVVKDYFFFILLGIYVFVKYDKNFFGCYYNVKLLYSF